MGQPNRESRTTQYPIDFLLRTMECALVSFSDKAQQDGSNEKEDHFSPDAQTLAAVHGLQVNVLGGDGDISGDVDDWPGPKIFIEESIRDWAICTIGS